MQHRHQWPNVIRLVGAAIALTLGTVACASPEDEPPPARAGNGASTSLGGAVIAETDSSGGRSGSAGSKTLQLGGSETAPPPIDAEVCQGETYEGKAAPVDMYFLVDSSTSMAEPVDGGTKWEVVVNALVSFLNGAHPVDGAVGLGYFPNGAVSACKPGQRGCVCIPYTNRCASNLEDSCAPADYKPAADLSVPPDTARVVADLAAHQLSGGTPTRPAIEGTLQYLEQWATSHPERQVILVVATDGEPTGCDRNRPQDIAALTAQAWSGPHTIRTFVLGVGAMLSSLDAIAQAGGTNEALLVDTSGDLAKQLSEALERIRSESAVSCDFTIPDGGEGMQVDPSKVNVRASTAGGSSSLVSQTFMSDPGNCDAAGGWYYDDPANPTKIKLCDSTCRELQRGRIQIQYGCDTVVRPPR